MVRAELLELIKVNSGNPDLIASDITDAVVRGDSYEQGYDEETDVNTVDFIVDVPSFKQSYQAHYEWTNDEESHVVNNTDRGMDMLHCLPTHQLIYGSFSCQDRTTMQNEWPRYDDILGYQAYFYSADNYYIYPGATTGDKPLLIIHINTYETDAELRDSYKSEALNKIREWSFNPDDYDITFEYNS